MSTSIDQRIVEMRFDNGQFESGVATTMSSLSRLKQSLNFDDSAQAVSLKFNAMYTYIDQTMRRITDTVNGYAKRMISALTIDPVKMGFDEYETKINSIQTIMSNTASKGTTMEDVTRVIGELNTYADKTIYNFAEMTRNIGTFTAAGVGLEESATAIQGIANLAAVSGSNSQQASTAMYQLSQAMASGTVKLMDWNSVVNAGMGGQVFQDALKKTAKTHGVAVDDMIKKHGSFRESLTEGWITTEILTETLAKMTKSGAAEYLAKTTGIAAEQITAVQELVATNRDGTASYDELAETLAKTGKISKDEAIDILKLADNAEDAATKVKTFTQLWDTLKESAQSGWSQSWEIIIGNFEEAKELLTDVSEVIGGMIGKSADARNEMLENWKVLGGRTELIDAVRNAFEGVMSVIKPIGEAMKDIFPPMTAERLLDITKNLKNFTAGLKLSDEKTDKIKRTFRGLFAVIDIGVQFVSAIVGGLAKLVNVFVPVGDGLLDFTAGLGDALVGLRDYIETSGVFNKAIGMVVDVLTVVINALKKFVGMIAGAFGGLGRLALTGVQSFVERIQLRFESLLHFGENIKEVFSSIGSFFKALFGAIAPLIKGVKDMIVTLFTEVGNALKNANFNDALDILNVGLTGGLGVLVAKAIKILSNLEKGGIVGFLKNFLGTSVEPIIKGITEIIDGVTGCFKAFQSSLKADTLMKIAKAIGILTIALIGLALIDSDRLNNGLAAITGLFIELFMTMEIFNQIDGVTSMKKGAFGGIQKMVVSLIGVATTILLLSFVVTRLGGMDLPSMAKGLVGTIALLAAVAVSMKYFAVGIDKETGKAEKSIIKGTRRLIAITTALAALAGIVVLLGNMDFDKMLQGIFGMMGVVAAMSLLLVVMNKSKGISAKGGFGILLAAGAMLVFAEVLKRMDSIEWSAIGKGLVTIGGALLIFAVGLTAMKSAIPGAIALGIASISLMAFVGALSLLGKLEPGTIVKCLLTIGASLLILAFGLTAMIAALPGAAALLVASVSLMSFVGVLATLGTLSWGTIIKGLITIAASFAILGVAGALLAPLLPAIVGLGVALALIGAALWTSGVGTTLLAAGITALAVAFSASAALIVTGVKTIILGVISLAPAIIEGFGAAIIAFADVIIAAAPKIGEALVVLITTLCDVLMKCLPKIVDTVLALIIKILEALVKYTPKIVDVIFKFILGLLDGLSRNMPKLIQAVVNLFMSVFQGAIDALKNVDPETLIKGIASIGLLSGIMAALALLAPLIPMAMIGVLGLGAVIAELALVLAAIGGLAQIPGLKWLISEGGELMSAVGEAIGGFIGSIIGGVMGGISAQFPKIGQDLSKFMTNVQPFVDGASSIKPETLEGVKSLVGIILALTAANVLDGLTKWFTGGTSLADFGNELLPFGVAMTAFSKIVSGNIDQDAVNAAANAGLVLAEMAATVPNSGGLVSFFTGENDMVTFGAKLIPFGMAMVAFSNVVAGKIDATAIEAAANAGKTMVEMAATIPNTGGVVDFFTGSQDMVKFGAELIPFGAAMAAFSKTVAGNIDANAVEAASNAGKTMAEMAATIPATGGLVDFFTGSQDMAKFGAELVVFGGAMAAYSAVIGTINESAVTASAIAGKALAEMAATIPTSGGLFSIFSSDNDMGEFSKQLVAFGGAMALYSVAVSGVNVATLSSTTKAFGELVEMIRGMSGVNFEKMSSFGKSLKDMGKDAIDNFVETFANASGKAHKAAVNFLQEVTKGAKSKSKLVNSTFVDIAKAAAESTKGAKSSFYRAGQDLAAGLASGIKAGKSGVVNSASVMAQRAVEKVKELLDINSPSKVFTEIGTYVPEGFAIGIDKLGNTVAASASDMGDSAIKGVKDSISRIADAINSDIDANPTIRPVLDLSAVRTGATAISSMFGSGSIGVAANVGAISSAMNRQNGGNTDVVSAIDKLRKDFSKMERTTYNLNGVTYTEGSDVADAFKVLVREAKLERRR